jgi:hypothetical protein
MSNRQTLAFINCRDLSDPRDIYYAQSVNSYVNEYNKNRQTTNYSYHNDPVYPVGSNGSYMTHQYSGSNYSLGRTFW